MKVNERQASGVLLWVSHLPGDGGKDWGFHSDSDKAIAFSPYWLRRWNKRCRDLGR